LARADGSPSQSDEQNRWRKLNPGQQGFLVLAYLRKGETFAELAAGFGVGTTTAWRYVEETVALIPIDQSPRTRPSTWQVQETRHESAGHRPP
jgi:Helix-turn-helix of DDE superfamily endonuclease